jgi:hypothetical protein
MDRDAVLGRFGRLNVWSRGGQRAPHKPLLVLYALGRWARGDRAEVSFAEVARDLTALLKEFGPPRRVSLMFGGSESKMLKASCNATPLPKQSFGGLRNKVATHSPMKSCDQRTGDVP